MERFPIVEARDLEGRRYRVPDDLPKGRRLVVVPFRREQQIVVEGWKAAVDELADTYPDLTVWEMPALSKGYTLVRPYIDGGMRAGIPDLDVRRHTITAYTDLGALTRLLGIDGRDTVHVFLLDTHGRIVWRDSGEVDEAKMRLLAEAMAEVRV